MTIHYGNRLRAPGRPAKKPLILAAAVTFAGISPLSSQPGPLQAGQTGADRSGFDPPTSVAALMSLQIGMADQQDSRGLEVIPEAVRFAFPVKGVAHSVAPVARSKGATALSPRAQPERGDLATALVTPARNGKPDHDTDEVTGEGRQTAETAFTQSQVRGLSDGKLALDKAFDQSLPPQLAGMDQQSKQGATTAFAKSSQATPGGHRAEPQLTTAAGTTGLIPGTPDATGKVATLGVGAAVTTLQAGPATPRPELVAPHDVAASAPGAATAANGPAQEPVALLQANFNLSTLSPVQATKARQLASSHRATPKQSRAVSPGQAKPYRLTGRGIEFSMSVVVNGQRRGKIPMLVATGQPVQVKLGDLLDLVAPLMTSDLHQRLSQSQAALEFITLSDLRKSGLDFRYDAARDQLVLDGI